MNCQLSEMCIQPYFNNVITALFHYMGSLDANEYHTYGLWQGVAHHFNLGLRWFLFKHNTEIRVLPGRVLPLQRSLKALKWLTEAANFPLVDVHCH